MIEFESDRVSDSNYREEGSNDIGSSMQVPLMLAKLCHTYILIHIRHSILYNIHTNCYSGHRENCML